MKTITPLKINVGSGNRYKDGWKNVDLYAERSDIREDLRTVEFPPGAADTILASHVLEHFERDQALELCRKFSRWLQPGGRLIVEMPNWSRCCKLGAADDLKSRLGGLKGLLGGRQTEKDIWHAWMLENQQLILDHAQTRRSFEEILPPEWNLPGWNHIYVWDANEFRDEMETLGFAATVHRATIHGPRHGRDFRVEAIKQ